MSKVSPIQNSTCSRYEDEQLNKLTSDLLQKAACCIFSIVLSIALGIMGVVVLFSAISSNNGYEYFLTVLCEVSAGLLFHLSSKAKVKIVKRIRKAFMTVEESCSRNISPLVGKEDLKNSNHANIGVIGKSNWLEHYDAQVRFQKDLSKPHGRLSLPCLGNNELRIVLERTDENGHSPSAPPMSPG